LTLSTIQLTNFFFKKVLYNYFSSKRQGSSIAYWDRIMAIFCCCCFANKSKTTTWKKSKQKHWFVNKFYGFCCCAYQNKQKIKSSFFYDAWALVKGFFYKKRKKHLLLIFGWKERSKKFTTKIINATLFHLRWNLEIPQILTKILWDICNT
jgi:hypothetical protein